MKKYLKFVLALLFCSSFSVASNAQYYQIASQLPSLINPALSGSLNYRGFVDASYVKGFGKRQVDFVSISTSQGFRYGSWFYMGVGVGVDYLMSHVNEGFGQNQSSGGGYWNHSSKKNGFMIPVFSDFRFTLGNTSNVAFFINARLGASFLLGNNYIAIADGFLTSREYFYLKPSLGLRIPIGSEGKKGVDIGVTYQFLTSNYWYITDASVSLNAVGATVSFEW